MGLSTFCFVVQIYSIRSWKTKWHPHTVSEEISRHNRSRSQCFQVQLVTCCDDLPVFLNKIEEYSTNSSQMMGNLPEFLNFNRFKCDTSGQFSLFIARILEGSGSFVLYLLLFLEQFPSCAHNHHHHHHRYYDRGRLWTHKIFWILLYNTATCLDCCPFRFQGSQPSDSIGTHSDSINESRSSWRDSSPLLWSWAHIRVATVGSGWDDGLLQSAIIANHKNCYVKFK